MSEGQARETLRAPGARLRGPETPAAAVALGAAIALVLVVLRIAILAAVGAFHPGDVQDHRIAVVVALLTGFTSATVAYGRTALDRDLELWRERLGWSPDRMDAFRRHFAPRRGATLAFMAAASFASLFLVTGRNTSVPFLFTDGPTTPNVVWSFASNVLLFSVIGIIASVTVSSTRMRHALEAEPFPLDLLDLSDARRISASGLRYAFFWLGGSSIASVLFIDLNFSWMTVAVVALSVAIGTWLFAAPLVRFAARVHHEKERELRDVRARIRTSRDALLRAPAGAAGAETAELPALLAWEQRIAAVPEWSVDLSSVLRFGTLVVLAVGSWLGGALTDRAVDSILR